MEDVKEQMTKVLEHFKQQRDELHVQLHLANADAKDEWARLENQWEETKSKLEAAREEVDKTTESVGAALGRAIDELKKGYERLRGHLRAMRHQGGDEPRTDYQCTVKVGVALPSA